MSNTFQSIVYPNFFRLSDKEMLEVIYEDLKEKGLEQEQFAIEEFAETVELKFKNKVYIKED